LWQPEDGVNKVATCDLLLTETGKNFHLLYRLGADPKYNLSISRVIPPNVYHIFVNESSANPIKYLEFLKGAEGTITTLRDYL
jgi:hypothetical protein